MSGSTIDQREGAVSFHGTPMTLVGPELHVGDRAPTFSIVTTEMKPFALDDLTDGGKRAALLIVVPSLDTGVCSLETQTFHKRLGELPANVKAYVVSRDLPFAMQRWATENSAANIAYLSDFKERSFGPAFGTEVKELGLLSRAIFLVSADGKITYAEYVKEISDQPAFDAVFAAAAKL